MLSPTLSALTPSPAPQPSHAAPAPAPNGSDDASQASFARSLQQARQSKPEHASRAAESRKGSSDAKATDKTAKVDKADKADKAGKSEEHDPHGDAPQAGKPHDDPAATLDQLLPGWNPALPRADAAPRGDAATGQAADDATAGADTAKAGGAARGKPGVNPLAADAAKDTRKPAAAADTARFSDALAATGKGVADRAGAAEPQRALATADTTLTALQASTSSAAPSTQAAGAPQGAAAPFEARLSAALDGPDFAPALGVQVSILVREGVQEARLHLNPAEMGPIAVQIALDGQNAQVHFQAEHAATRDALQASLSDLAAALQDNGFTLSGGGVSDSRRDAQDARGEGHAERDPGGVTNARAEGDAAQAAAAPVRAPRRQGVVDLYA